MSTVRAERMAAEIEGDFVVFLIGMRINKPWKVHKWLPVFLAMPRMLKELETNPDSGLIGYSQAGLMESSTGAPLSSSKRTRVVPMASTGRPGWHSTSAAVGAAGMWGSGTRRIEYGPVSMRPSIAACPPTGWARQAN